MGLFELLDELVAVDVISGEEASRSRARWVLPTPGGPRNTSSGQTSLPSPHPSGHGSHRCVIPPLQTENHFVGFRFGFSASTKTKSKPSQAGAILKERARERVILAPHHEIVSHKLYRPRYLPLRLPTIRPAQDGFEPIRSRKVLKLPVQRGILLLQKPLDHHLLHVIVQNFLQVSPKVPKRVLMAAYLRLYL